MNKDRGHDYWTAVDPEYLFELVMETGYDGPLPPAVAKRVKATRQLMERLHENQTP